VGRIRRVSETLGFDRDGAYIPPCAAVIAHSRLYAGWARLRDGVAELAERYGELHRAVAAYAERLAERGVDVRGDLDTLAFVERAVLALDDCAYALVDPARAPAPVFADVERLGRRVALALDLSAATRLFLHAVSTADAGYEVLLDEERQALARRRGTAAQEAERGELSRALARAEDTVRRVRELGAAVEGKYVDYRLNRAVDALRFLLDRGGEGFYTGRGHARAPAPRRRPAHVRLLAALAAGAPGIPRAPGRRRAGREPVAGGRRVLGGRLGQPRRGRRAPHVAPRALRGARSAQLRGDLRRPGRPGHRDGHARHGARVRAPRAARGVVPARPRRGGRRARGGSGQRSPVAAPAFVPPSQALGSGLVGGPGTATPVAGTPVVGTPAVGTPAVGAPPYQTPAEPRPDAPVPPTPPLGAPVIKRIPLRKPGA
jgi:hypothetical protein